MYDVSIIGLGFVGLTTAVVFASKGRKIIGVDIDDNKLKQIAKGRAYFYEHNLEPMLQSVLENKIFVASNDLPLAVKNSRFTFITVGTPSLPNGGPDLSYVKNAAIEIGKSIKDIDHYHTVVVKSTVPPGTTSDLISRIISKYSGKKVNDDFGVAYNPEFLREGNAIEDSLHPHILVIGAENPAISKELILFYKSIHEQLPAIIDTNIATSELIKYANNTFLATKISFINTIANICRRIPGADVEVVAKAIGIDPRIGKLFLKAGPGYGGSCFPKDVSSFINFSKSIGYDPILLESTQRVNERQYLEVMNMILQLTKGVRGKRIAILGLAFKKDTDDVRESVPLKLIRELRRRGARIKVHDPMAMPNARRIIGDSVEYCNTPLDCINEAECVVIMTEWDQYKTLSYDAFKKNMKYPNIIDARRIIDYNKLDGINFMAIGLGKRNPTGENL